MDSNCKSTKPTKRRDGKEEIGDRMMADSIIAEIDRLDAIGRQASETAKIYCKILGEIKSARLKVDITPLETKQQQFVQEMDKKIREIKEVVNTQEKLFGMLIAMWSVIFTIGFMCLNDRWKQRYASLERQFTELQVRTEEGSKKTK